MTETATRPGALPAIPSRAKPPAPVVDAALPENAGRSQLRTNETLDRAVRAMVARVTGGISPHAAAAAEVSRPLWAFCSGSPERSSFFCF